MGNQRRKKLINRHLSLYLKTLPIALAALFSVSCGDNPVYSRYESIDVSGWKRPDTLNFHVKPVRESGNYACLLGLRINDYYPFTQLGLILGCEIITEEGSDPDRKGDHPAKRKITMTLFDSDGIPLGNGTNHYQYTFPLSEISLSEGDSLRLWIVHNMVQDSIPGITDIGIMLGPPLRN